MTNEELEDEFWFCERMVNGHKNSGYIVTTKTGLQGRTYHSDELVNGKQPIHVVKDGEPMKMLCTPDSLVINGFID